MVPSMSDTTTLSVASQRNILAVQATAPVVSREKVIVFAPDFRLSCFYRELRIEYGSRWLKKGCITSWSDVSRRVFALHSHSYSGGGEFFRLIPGGSELARGKGMLLKKISMTSPQKEFGALTWYLAT